MLIFHHIGKNGGTSLRNIIKKNYPPNALLELYGPNRGSVEWYRNYYHSLEPIQKTSIQCIAAHTAHFMIPVLEELAHPFQVFCLLREPVDRVISWYHFALLVAETDNGGAGQVGRMLKQHNWGIEDIYLNLGGGAENDSEKHKLFRHFFNGQARTILAPHVATAGLKYISEPPKFYEDKLWAIMQQYYIVGTQEHFKASIKNFARQFGWQDLSYTKENVTKTKPKVSELPTDVIALIQTYNQLDTQLHNKNQLLFEKPSFFKKLGSYLHILRTT
jgi:hypothetical protein